MDCRVGLSRFIAMMVELLRIPLLLRRRIRECLQRLAGGFSLQQAREA